MQGGEGGSLMAGFSFFYFINPPLLTQPSPTVTASLTHLLLLLQEGEEEERKEREGKKAPKSRGVGVGRVPARGGVSHDAPQDPFITVWHRHRLHLGTVRRCQPGPP